MEQSLAPGSQTFEQDLFRLYKTNVITLEEALGTSDSPTNLSWLINNSEFGNSGTATIEEAPAEPSIDPHVTNPTGGASFKEFTLSMSDE